MKEHIKNLIHCKHLTWFGKLIVGLAYICCCLLISVCFMVVYVFYIPFAIIRWSIFGKWHLCNLWEMTDWSICEEDISEKFYFTDITDENLSDSPSDGY